MFNFVQQIIDGHLKSFSNEPGGYSGKKLSAFYVILFTLIIIEAPYIIWSYRHETDPKAWIFVPELTVINLAFGAAALGINGWEKIKTRNKTQDENTNTNGASGADNNQLQ